MLVALAAAGLPRSAPSHGAKANELHPHCALPSNWPQLRGSSVRLLKGLAAHNGTDCFRSSEQLHDALHAADKLVLVKLVQAARPQWISRHALFPAQPGTTRAYLPPGTIEVKISVGESFHAPNANKWFSLLPNASGVTVYAFEPNPVSCAILTLGLGAHGVTNWRGGSSAQGWLRENSLPSTHINTNYLLTCAAVSDETPAVQTFHSTPAGDTSSLNEPINLKRLGPSSRLRLNVTTLEAFFETLPWSETMPETLPAGSPGVVDGVVNYVSQVKTDTQGHDLKAFRGLGRFFRERVVYATPEMGNKPSDGYRLPEESGDAKFNAFLKGHGFVPFRSRYCVDPTFVNTRLRHLGSKANVPFIHGGPPRDTPKDSALFGPPELRGANVACTGTR